VCALKEIKIKQTKKDIKVLDKTTDVTRRAKNAYIRTKERYEQLGHNDDSNYVDYADNIVSDGAKNITRKGEHIAKIYGRKAIEKIKNRKAQDNDSTWSDTHNADNVHQSSQGEAKEVVKGNAARTEAEQTAQQNCVPAKVKDIAKQKNTQLISNKAATQNSSQMRAKETVNRKFTLSKPGEAGKRRFVQNRANQQLTQSNPIPEASRRTFRTQASQKSGHITAHSPQNPVSRPIGNGLRRDTYFYSKTGHTVKQSAKTGVKTIKKGSKGTVKTVKKSVKTTKRTAKTAIKTSQAAAKTAVKTAQATRRAVQAARAAARAAAFTAKMTVKAMIAAIKAIILAVKGTIALIAAGGWVVLVIVLVICLAGFLLGSVFGVFFSNESPGENMPTMTEIVQQLNEEYYSKIEQIKAENPHDTLELSSNSGGNSATVNNWREILPVYAVKTATDPDNGMDVATLDGTKVGILRSIFWDMNQISYWIETIEHEETVITEDEDGNEIEETITTTETILHIELASKTHVDMIAEYHFNSEQIELLNELMEDEYQRLFVQLIEG
jgi:hypothetical protein